MINPQNERLKREYYRFQKEACRKADATVDGIRKALDRFENYTRHGDFGTFGIEQAVGFKEELARSRNSRTGEPMSKSTLVMTIAALKEFFHWLSQRPGYKSRIRSTDVEFLNLSANETRAAKAPRFKTYPTIEEVRAVIAAMPIHSDVDKRNRALITLAILTGARDSALASLRLKHIDLERKLVMQDPTEVRTKRGKRIDTFFFPLGQDLETIVVEWVRYLKEDKLYDADDPVFPRTRVQLNEAGAFTVEGLERVFWENTQPIRQIFRDAFVSAGLPYYRPHSFRDTLALYGETHSPSIEHFKAWSVNLGHERITTTLTNYGSMSSHRQRELVRSMEKIETKVSDPRAAALANEILELVRSRLKDTEIGEETAVLSAQPNTA
jgi:integrase